MKRTIKAIVATATIVGLATQVNAASDTGNAIQIVTETIAISNTADLDFGTAPQGDAAKQVLPADPEAGSFDVTGSASTAYTITLPLDGVVVMATGGGGTADTEIAVDSFASSPSGTGMLDGSGQQTLTVGATRAALSATQTAGSYTGSYTVDVVY